MGRARQTTRGWAKYNKYYWLEGDYSDFLRFFFSQMFTEPHSTKQIEDCVGWGHEIVSPDTVRHHGRPARLRGRGVHAARAGDCARAVPGHRDPRHRRPDRPPAGR